MNFSYSRMSCYTRCPKKFEFKYIFELKPPNEDTVIFERGRYLHTLLEHYPTLPEFQFKFSENELMKMDYITLISNFCRDKKVKHLFDITLYKEKQFYLDKDLNNCEVENQLINGSIDYVGKSNDQTIVLVDWKSGKTQKYASFEQLKLYSLWAFNEFPDINKVVAILYFIEQDLNIRLDIIRDEVQLIKDKTLELISEINNSTEFKKNIKEDCQYCPFYEDCKPYKVKI